MKNHELMIFHQLDSCIQKKLNKNPTIFNQINPFNSTKAYALNKIHSLRLSMHVYAPKNSIAMVYEHSCEFNEVCYYFLRGKI